MKTTSLRSRVILYLAKYTNYEMERGYGAPYEITQDGIAIALGITRSYTSLVLGRLEKTGAVQHKNSIIRNAHSRGMRFVYTLTEQGMLEYEDVMKDLTDNGLRPEDVIMMDLNHSGTDRIMSGSKEDLAVIGAICVSRTPINRNDLPQDFPATIPFDIQGFTRIKQETVDRILARASPEDLAMFHSKAADICMDSGKDVKERVHHLVNANRFREAARLVLSSKYELEAESDAECIPDLLKLCLGLPDPDVAVMTARISLANGRTDAARKAVSSSEDIDGNVKDALMSEISLKEGNLE